MDNSLHSPAYFVMHDIKHVSGCSTLARNTDAGQRDVIHFLYSLLGLQTGRQEGVMTVKNRLDATKYAVFIASACFGHQYAHHQEYN
jgi:uncharacterized protein YfiM (DUF2279 family)